MALRQPQIWNWQGPDLPRIYRGEELLQTLTGVPEFAVAAVMEMARQR